MATTYANAKLRALELLDEVTTEDLVRRYGTKFSAKTKLFLDLGIPPERTAVMAPTVNDTVKELGSSKRITSAALSKLRTVGEFIETFCAVAQVKVPSGEPT